MKIFTDEFKKEEFLNPPLKNSPIYFWIWNGKITKEKTEERLLEMHRLGVKGFYIVALPKTFRPISMPTELEPEYLSKPYMEEIWYVVKRAKELSMYCWLYDEGGWPSGGACNKVMLDHPEYARRTLSCRETTFKKGDVYKKSSDEIVGSFINTDILIEEGYVFSDNTVVDEYFSLPHLFEYPGSVDFPDVTRREAADCFIEITHEEYKKYIGEFFGNTMPVVFTDEPCMPNPFTFREETIKAYEEEYNESLIPALPALFGKAKPDEKTAEMRVKYFDLISHMFCDNFIKPCREWSHKNGMEITGHMNLDHMTYGNIRGGTMFLMRALRNLDIPGVDVIWRQIFPDGDCAKSSEAYLPNKFFPRYASSAAAQNGGEAAMTESLAVYGNGTTFHQMRYVFGFQAIRGINIFNPALLQYERKGGMMAGEHPAFFEDQACHGDLKEFNEYLERLSYLVTVGKRVCDTAMYLPIRDLWAGGDAESIADSIDALGMEIEKLHIDFDVIDDDILEIAKVTDKGEISIGNACYKRIVMLPAKYMSDKAKSALDEFKKNGGIVCSIDEVYSPEEIVGCAEGLQLMKREAKGQTMYCLFNQNSVTSEFKINVSGRKGFFVNVTEGKTEPLSCEDDCVKVTLESGEVGGICLTDAEFTKEDTNTFKREILIDGKFSFKRLESFEVGLMYAESHKVSEDASLVELGDWTELIGKEFSGSCLYEKEFSMAEAVENAILDLGDVKHTCEVILNGKSLGKKIMPPYRFEIKKEDIKKDNHLSVIVKNTPGNQFIYSKELAKWPEWRTTPYFKVSRIFDEETVQSGLYGPVKILY